MFSIFLSAVLALFNRRSMVDTFAMLSYAFVTAMFLEVVVSGMSLEQSLQSRMMAIPLALLLATPFCLYRDFLIARLSGRKPLGWFASTLLDTLAFLSFQLPIYALQLWFVGVDGTLIITACGSLAFASLFMARPLGLYIQLCRKAFGVTKLIPVTEVRV